MFIVKQTFTNETVCSVKNKEELMKFIGKRAIEDNYGMYRHWVKDGIAYFDCGPRTYYVDADVLKTE